MGTSEGARPSSRAAINTVWAEATPNDVGSSGLLKRTFGALDGGVRYCVLRGLAGTSTAMASPDIDLLADPRDIPMLERIVASLGYLPLPSLGHAGHRFYLAFDEGTTEWLKLDVVTRLRYGGRNRPLAPRGLIDCLDRRCRVGTVWLPNVVDSLLALMLHAMLDKRAFHELHRQELVRLRDLVGADPSLNAAARRRFATVLGRAIPWDYASDAIQDRAWDSLLRRRQEIARQLFLSAPLDSTLRWLANTFARILRWALGALRHPTTSIKQPKAGQ